ncbi:MAG: hypothetical protein JNJ73_17690 [Hyphomonadaceae bacterium]|nr:hypothetical protein [Hyphomonadaceae bacterium]
MLKTVLAATAALGFAALGAACSQQASNDTATNAEEVGERLDSAYETATTGEKNLSDGPMENAGEKLDNAAREAGANVQPDAPPPADTNPPG